MRGFMLGVIMVGLAGCDRGGFGANEALTRSLSFGPDVGAVPGPLPGGSGNGPTVAAPPSGGMAFPGQAIDFMVPWNGGEISGVNIGFGGSQYFNAPMPPGVAPGMTSGTAMVSAQISSTVCADLSNICHQIQCFEQVTLPDGRTVSNAAAVTLILNCTGTPTCNVSSSCNVSSGISALCDLAKNRAVAEAGADPGCRSDIDFAFNQCKQSWAQADAAGPPACACAYRTFLKCLQDRGGVTCDAGSAGFGTKCAGEMAAISAACPEGGDLP